MHVLNPVAAAVWDGLAEARDAEALLAHCRLTLEGLDGVELVTEVRDTIAELDRAGLLDPPPLPEDPLAAGAVLLARRRFAEAAAVLATPEALAGEAGRRAHALLGVARMAAGDLVGASAALLAGLARWPDDPALLNNLGGVHLLAGHPAEAARAYEQALEIDAGRAEVWSNLGSVRLRQGESDAAAACYQRALALDPLHVHALEPLASLHLAAGRRAEGMKLLREAAGYLHVLSHVYLCSAWPVFHAAAAARDGRGLMVCAPSATGTSSGAGGSFFPTSWRRSAPEG